MSHNSFATQVPVTVDKTSTSGQFAFTITTPLGDITQNSNGFAMSGSLPYYLLSTGSSEIKYLWDYRQNFTVSNYSDYDGAEINVGMILEYRGTTSTSSFSSQQYQHSVTMTFADNSTQTYDCYTGNGQIYWNTSSGNAYYYATCQFVASKSLKSFVHRVGNSAFTTSNSLVKMGVGQGNGLYLKEAFYSGTLYQGETPVYLPQLDGISNQLDDLSDTIEDHYDQENDAIDNISNQQPPASGSGQNSTTSSLLDTLGSFLTAITNLSATNCEVVLAFPSFAGGSQTVNICQNKEYTGNIVSIAGSIILVLFYLPVAFMLINKIYSEIRSFTNG